MTDDNIGQSEQNVCLALLHCDLHLHGHDINQVQLGIFFVENCDRSSLVMFILSYGTD